MIGVVVFLLPFMLDRLRLRLPFVQRSWRLS
jgi:TRAP-type mannitol/chloroaromatic compound transport system permease small subunit